MFCDTFAVRSAFPIPIPDTISQNIICTGRVSGDV
jgi:hypothetical protein